MPNVNGKEYTDCAKEMLKMAVAAILAGQDYKLTIENVTPKGKKEQHIEVKIYCREGGWLIGKRGVRLNSLARLLERIIQENCEEDYVLASVEENGYRWTQ